ncbi:hypothetical protein [Peribacillus sp. NJ4]|uniref:hypothetical protein n=1 Tax=Peribacillus sp. NJ4 TaxID=3055862 RepID=UPI0025A1FF50|nr:hypothetical protein [Peribacillus sp. NJ4]
MSMQLLKLCSKCGEVIEQGNGQCVMSVRTRVRQDTGTMTRQEGTSSQLMYITLRHGMM